MKLPETVCSVVCEGTMYTTDSRVEVTVAVRPLSGVRLRVGRLTATVDMVAMVLVEMAVVVKTWIAEGTETIEVFKSVLTTVDGTDMTELARTVLTTVDGSSVVITFAALCVLLALIVEVEDTAGAATVGA